MPLEVATATLPLHTGRRADGNYLAQGVYGLARRLGVGVGSKVARALAVPLASVLDGGGGVAHRERDVGIALVILEVDVEVGMILGDEVALQDERLVLRAHDNVVEAAYHLHHERDLCAVIREPHVLEHAGTEVLGLAHVDDLPLGILPEVAARLCGNLAHLLGDGRQALSLGTGGLEVEIGHVGRRILDAHGAIALPIERTQGAA